MNEKCTSIYFDIIKSIGNNEGKNSDVFLAKDKQLDALLVIKRIEKNTIRNVNDYFLESRILYDTKHPNIMEIQYASQDDDYIYLAMPYCEKGSLSSIMDKQFLTVREIIEYSLDFLSGLNYIHSKNLIHLDIKPTNIIINNSNKAIITDFGLSKYLNQYGTAQQKNNYIYHLDPEYFMYNKRTVLSDIYQVGLTLYRMCNGNGTLKRQMNILKIENGDDLKDSILKGKYPDRNYYLPHIPRKLRLIINKALKVDCKKRYNNVIEIMNDLSKIEDKNIDWIFTNNYNELYYSIKNKYKYSISLISNDEKKDIITSKRNLDTGRTSKQNKFCKKGNTSKEEIIKEITQIIKEHDIK